jgi:hypothetical protein
MLRGECSAAGGGMNTGELVQERLLAAGQLCLSAQRENSIV